MKSSDVTIQMKPFQQYFAWIGTICLYVVLTFESVDEIQWCDIQIKPFEQYFHMAQNESCEFWRILVLGEKTWHKANKSHPKVY